MWLQLACIISVNIPKSSKPDYSTNTNLAELVYDTLRGGAFPLVIGGDHSLGLGSASGVGKCYDDFGIIWLDAHGDINTSETSPSGNIHGMPLSALIRAFGECLGTQRRRRT